LFLRDNVHSRLLIFVLASVITLEFFLVENASDFENYFEKTVSVRISIDE